MLPTSLMLPHTRTTTHSHTHTHSPPHTHVHTGDDLQRQLGSLTVVRPSKVFRIFISRLSPECLLGLPGLMCSIGASRVRGHATADIPVHIYGPSGIAEFLCTIFKVGVSDGRFFAHTHTHACTRASRVWCGLAAFVGTNGCTIVISNPCLSLYTPCAHRCPTRTRRSTSSCLSLCRMLSVRRSGTTPCSTSEWDALLFCLAASDVCIPF